MIFFATAGKATEAERRLLDSAFIASGWIFVALFAFEILAGGIFSRLAIAFWDLVTSRDSGPPRPTLWLLEASAALAVFAWPCLLAIHRRHGAKVAIPFAVAVGAVLLFQNMQASLVAYGLGIMAFGAVFWRRPFGIAAVLGGLAVINIVVLFAALELWSSETPKEIFTYLTGGARERLHIIDFIYEKVIENPLIGWGFDSSRAVGQDLIYGQNNTFIPLHPHNIWAQTWLELGLVGMIAVIALVAAVLIRIAAAGQGRVVIAVSIAAVTTYLLIGNISYGMWQNWWLGVAWLNAGFLAVAAAAGEDGPN